MCLFIAFDEDEFTRAGTELVCLKEELLELKQQNDRLTESSTTSMARAESLESEHQAEICRAKQLTEKLNTIEYQKAALEALLLNSQTEVCLRPVIITYLIYTVKCCCNIGVALSWNKNT